MCVCLYVCGFGIHFSVYTSRWRLFKNTWVNRICFRRLPKIWKFSIAIMMAFDSWTKRFSSSAMSTPNTSNVQIYKQKHSQARTLFGRIWTRRAQNAVQGIFVFVCLCAAVALYYIVCSSLAVRFKCWYYIQWVHGLSLNGLEFSACANISCHHTGRNDALILFDQCLIWTICAN